jgi:hypothetical protein
MSNYSKKLQMDTFHDSMKWKMDISYVKPTQSLIIMDGIYLHVVR